MAGVKGALIGSLWLMLSIIPLSIILGIGTAIYLEEYAKNNKFTQFVKISISNLAGVPSVVFGLLGYTLFVGGAGLKPEKWVTVYYSSANNDLTDITNYYCFKSGSN